MIRVTTIWTNMSGFFNSVEVNSTFLPVSQLKNCYATTPDYLTFSIKMNRNITHTRRLHDVRRPLNDFLETCSVLGDKLGPFLIGLSPAFKKDLERFDEFLSILPEHRFGFEFRHSSWFDDEVFERFRVQRELILTMLGAQFDSNAECFADFAYIRWHARGRN